MQSLYYKAFNYIESSQPLYLGIYFSLLLHLSILLFDKSAWCCQEGKTEKKKNILWEIISVRCGIGCASEDVLSIEAAYSTKHQAGLGVCAFSDGEQ